MKFSNIKLHHWRQFETVDIDFHDRLTVLTGANGAGKTTILNMLNRHFGWGFQLMSTPANVRRGSHRYFADLWGRLENATVDDNSTVAEIGAIRYDNGQNATISVPHKVADVYNPKFSNQQPVQGIFIPSHRPAFFYQPVTQIPTRVDAKEQIVTQYINDVRSRYSFNARITSLSHRIKTSLISLAVFGTGNSMVEPNEEALGLFRGYEEVLRVVLPETLKFSGIKIRNSEVVFKTQTDEFSFDAVSGGVAAIIDLSWQFYLFSVAYDRFVAVIDEPENHLHPRMQQTLLPKLLDAFPSAQFIVATHNPFMVSSVADSNVYVLDYSDEGKVSSQLLDLLNKAATSNEILREVLGLERTLPLWVDRSLDQIVEKYSARQFDEAALNDLKIDLRKAGLSHVLPAAISGIIEADD